MISAPYFALAAILSRSMLAAIEIGSMTILRTGAAIGTILLACIWPGRAQGDWRMIGQIGGPVQTVAVAGNLAYVGVGQRLVVLDITNPQAPLEIGSTAPFPHFVHGVAVSGNLAAVAAGAGGLRVVDISNPSRPMETGAWNTPGYAEGVALRGTTAFLADGPFGLRIFDLSEQVRPRELAAIFDRNYAYGIALEGDTALVASAGAGLLLADVANPGQPRELTTLDTAGYAFGVSAADGLAYVADGWGGVEVVNIRDPNRPFRVAICPTTGWSFGTAVHQGRIYVANGGYGLLILDARTLQILGHYETGQAIYGAVAVAGRHALVADRRMGLRILDVSEPTRPMAAGTYSTIGMALAVTASEGAAFVSEGGRLAVVDLSDPRRPRLASRYADVNFGNSRIHAIGRKVLSSGGLNATEGLYVIDAADLSRPTRFAFAPCRLQGPWRGLALDAGRLYTADEWGLGIFDVTDLANPRWLRHVKLHDWPGPSQWAATLAVAVANGLAYVTSFDGLKIVDVSVPGQALPIASIRAGQHYGGLGINLSGDLLFVSGLGGLDVLSLANPRAPAAVTELSAPSETFQSLLVGNQLLTADTSLGLGVIDLSSPRQPRRLPWRDTACMVAGIAVASGLIVAADWEGGLAIFARDEISATVPPGAAHPVLPITENISPPFRPIVVPPPPVPAVPSGAAGVVVSSTADRGAGSFRAALLAAPANSTITFEAAVFPTASPAVIRLESALPPPARGVTIDASNAGVMIDGGGTVNEGFSLIHGQNTIVGLSLQDFAGAGIQVVSSYNRIGGSRSRGAGPLGEGNTIVGCRGDGISLAGENVHSNVVAGNYVGIDRTGAARPNFHGIGLGRQAHHNWIGGSSDAERNIISANQNIGIVLSHQAYANVVAGNLIGLTPDGRRSAGAQEFGVVISAPRNRIGGDTPEERNVVAGNSHYGISLATPDAWGNEIVGNYVNVTASGDALLTSQVDGIVLDGGATHTLVRGNLIGPSLTFADCAFNSLVGNWIGLDASGTRLLGAGAGSSWGFLNRIGGTGARDGNVIPGGLSLGFGWASEIVLGNTIGTDASGTRPLRSVGNAVTVRQSARRTIIGGATPAEGNLIGGVVGTGVQVDAGADHVYIGGNRLGVGLNGENVANRYGGVRLSYASGAVIQGNLIGHSGDSGVVVGSGTGNVIRRNAIFANAGAPILLPAGTRNPPAPVISSASPNSVAGTATPSAIVDIYSDVEDEGAFHEGSVTAGADGVFRFAATTPVRGPNLTATATTADGGTSEFSAARPIGPAGRSPAPAIIGQSSSPSSIEGGRAALGVTCAADASASYRWQMSTDGGVTWSELREDFHHTGVASPTLVISATPSGFDGNRYRCVVATTGGSVTSEPRTLSLATSRIANLSIRSTVAPGQPLVVGFVVNGGALPVLLRGIGPGLQAFVAGVAVAGDPRLELYSGDQVLVATNDNWSGTLALREASARVGAFPLVETSLDAGLLQPLLGAHTAHLTSGGAGLGLVEIYDASLSRAPARIANLSARTEAGAGDQTLVAGFVVSGSAARTLLLRGIGPALCQFGIIAPLADPMLQVFARSTPVARNDDWSTSPNADQIATVAAAVGAFPLAVGAKDAVLLVTLPPGAYTAQLSTAGETTGSALIEIYEIP